MIAPADLQPLGLSLAVSPEAGTLVVHATGEIDVASVVLLRMAAEAGAAAGCHRVVVDAAGITFLDAAGLNVMLRELQTSTADASTDHALRLRNPSDRVRRLLELIGRSDLVEEGRGGPDTTAPTAEHHVGRPLAGRIPREG